MDIQRDDLIAGGTKRRALQILLQNINERRISYAGTTMGHGALALAHACEDVGKQAEIFICADNDNEMVRKIRKTNAIIHLEAPAPISTLHQIAQSSGYTLPPGFDLPEFDAALVEAMKGYDVSGYSEIWTCSVSGTLTRALQKAFPHKVFKIVCVVKSGKGDFTAPEKYHQPAKSPPPFPSCPYTDAKIWQFALEHAADDALLWNTAG